MNADTTGIRNSPSGLTRVTMVVSSGCRFCADADEALEEFSRMFEIEVIRIATLSSQGMDLMQRFGAAMSPLVLVDGEFVSSGRLSRGRMGKMLAQRQPCETLVRP